MTKTWQLKLPKTKKHFMFSNDRKIYVAYGDGNKKMTYIKSNKFHREIPKSKILKISGYHTVHVRIGDIVWFLGGNDIAKSVGETIYPVGKCFNSRISLKIRVIRVRTNTLCDAFFPTDL